MHGLCEERLRGVGNDVLIHHKEDEVREEGSGGERWVERGSGLSGETRGCNCSSRPAVARVGAALYLPLRGRAEALRLR